MTDIPTRNSTGGLDCPRCGTVLVNGKSPLYLRKEYVGVFDSLLCRMCHYYLLTASGYDNALIEARKYGLVGPEEEVIAERIDIREKIEPSEHKFTFVDVEGSSNISGQVYVTKEPNSKLEISSLTSAEVPVLRFPFREPQPSRSTEVLLKQK